MLNRFNRRSFLKACSSSGLSLLILDNARSVRSYEVNERLDLAVIGAGGRGAANLSEVSTENIVALCDVDGRRAADAFANYPTAKKYCDFRKLLDQMESQIDAVVVSAPNHIHAPASVNAMRRGKHVYCEKPLSHSVFEARLAAKVAAKTKVATQMGTQIHATNNYRRIVELIQAGAIGEVRECHCWLRGGGSAGERPVATPPVPPELAWDLWLGPAPVRPYHPCYVPHDWHYWWDFGGGAFGNMGCHYLDLAFWALELRHPTTIAADGPPPHLESTPAWEHIRYEFLRGDGKPPVTLTWTHGQTAPPIFAQQKLPDWAWGVFVGTEGLLLASYPKHMLWPAEKFAGFEPPPSSIPNSVGHHREWINACKSGGSTSCSFSYSGAITETVLLGNIAYRVGEKLSWDGSRLEFHNCPAANEYLQRDYRPGWTL